MALELVDKGSLARPGPIGRLVRLVLGTLCLYGLWQLLKVAPAVFERPVELLPNLSLMILVVLCVFNYVVNIGFSKNWHQYPLVISVSILCIAAIGGFWFTGSPGSPLLGALLVLWMGYFYAHLGISFILAAIIATPGCEMRAIPQLLGRVTKSAVKEHHCPSSIISGLDRWEHNRQQKR